MLESLHVKNLALIDEADVEFTDGLNILTGETGAGKSILIGSIQLALGKRADKEYIRSGTEYALVEMTFSLNEEQEKQVRDMDFMIEEDHTLILQRKITPGRSVCRINGEMASALQLKQLSELLLDMCSQHENQTLLKPSRQAELLDSYAGADVKTKKTELKKLYREYKTLQEEFENNRMDEQERKREMDLLSFEVGEIEEAALVCGEDEELEKIYRKMSNARRIRESAGIAHGLTGYEEEGSAGEAIGRALRELKSVTGFDEEMESLQEQLMEIDNLLNDFNRSMADYMDTLSFDEEEYVRIQDRLNLLNHLKAKYNTDLEGIGKLQEEKQKRLEQLLDYDRYLIERKERLEESYQKLLSLCKEVSVLREEAAKTLAEKLTRAMKGLNFLHVDFSIELEREEQQITDSGYDKITFMISTNPGESKKPLSQVASGGELSRIMLAFKTVFADTENMGTLIFDEIDTGISGKTAWMVSEQLSGLALGHQVICITHLPQIAAQADAHFRIEKQVREERTATSISRLSDEEALKELARLLGSDTLTDAALSNAREMKALALKSKN